MSNRFHNKFHRHNHHTTQTDDIKYPDSSYDPIASPESPFRGEFYVDGNITTLSSVTATGNLHGTSVLVSETVEGNNGNFRTNLTTRNNISAGNLIYDKTGHSGNWNSVYTSVGNTSADWNSSYTNLVSNSAAYLSAVDLSFLSVSANWNSVYTTVQSNSATTWNYQGTDIKNLSSGWVGGNSAFTTVQSNSANWENTLTPIDYNYSSIIVGPYSLVLERVGTLNSKPYYRFYYSGNNGPELVEVYWFPLGPGWLFSWVQDGGTETYISTGDTQYPWQSTWGSGYSVSPKVSDLQAQPLQSTSSYGSSISAARADHVHPYPTASQVSAVSLTEFKSLSSNWQSSYTTVSSNSASYATISFANNKFLPLSGGTISGNLTITGNLSTLGSVTQIDTQVFVTSAVSVTNAGTGPALTVKQTGAQDIATFFDDSNTALIIKDGGNVGIGTSTPNEKLTVVGNISATGNLTSNTGIFTRHDSGNEGGEIQFCRSNDNSVFWSIDSYGSDSTPDFRIKNGTNIPFRLDGLTNNVGIGLDLINTLPSDQKLTVVGNISATGNIYADTAILTNATVQTFTNPATATGNFLILNINGSNKALRLWDFTS